MTNKQELLDILNRAFVEKYNSLAAYILAAHPYVAEGQEHMLSVVQEIADQDQIMCQELAQTIENLNGVPRTGPHDEMVSELNFLAIDYLVKTLAEQLQNQIEQHEEVLEKISDSEEAQRRILQVKDATSAQLEQLRKLN